MYLPAPKIEEEEEEEEYRVIRYHRTIQNTEYT
jgi:hypothetical protein